MPQIFRQRSWSASAIVAAAILIGMPVQALAKNCVGNAQRIVSGGHAMETVSIVVKKWCTRNYTHLGAFNKPMDLVSPPRFATVQVRNKYSFRIGSERAGSDEFTVRVYWLSRSGE